jgi:hypothetical protein
MQMRFAAMLIDAVNTATENGEHVSRIGAVLAAIPRPAASAPP